MFDDSFSGKRQALENRQAENFRRFLDRLEKKPDEINEAAEYLGCSPQTIGRWLNGGECLGGELTIRQEGFLRRKGVINPMVLGEDPSLSEVLFYGLSEKLFTADELSEALDITPASKLVNYAFGRHEPKKWVRARLEWFLHNFIIQPGGQPLRRMKRLGELPPEVAQLLIACCKGDLSPEIIAKQLDVSLDRVNSWMLLGDAKPTPSMIKRIYEEFTPHLIENVNCREQESPKRPNRELKAKVHLPTPPQEKTDEKQSSSKSTATTKSIADVIGEQAQLLRCLLLGYCLSLPQSQAIAELEKIRANNPDLWFELLLLVGVVADPSERYPTWRKSRR